MNRFRKRDEAVSPVIATILMVAITVVLAGVLVVYLQTLPQGGGSVETQLGIRVEKAPNGIDWIVSITTGSQKVTSIRVQIVNPATGAKTVNVALNVAPADAHFTFNNNDLANEGANPKINAGDSIMLKGAIPVPPAAADIQMGYTFSLLKGENTIAGPKELQ